MANQNENRTTENGVIVGMTHRGRGEYVVEEPVYYRINDDNTGPELLIEVCNERGWRSWDTKENTISTEGSTPHQWQLWWRHSFPGIVYRRLKQNQVLNHIARANGLCRKDILARTLHKMSNSFPQAFDFSPSTFLLPGEYTKLVAEYTRILYHSKSNKNNGSTQEDQGSSPSPRSSETAEDSSLNIWICKPTGSSQGKGISIFQDLHELTYGGSAVVQRYLEHPLLVGGYKCDIRLYVLVTSFVPLSIYIYSEGIVRFGTEKYNLKALDNPFSHLTNTSINRMSPGYKLEKNRVGTGCKWTLRQLRRYLKSNGQRDWLLWQKVNILVSLTLLSQVGRIAYNNHNQFQSGSDHPRFGTCFELYGFDILVDETLTPWLLEVNRCPSLTYDCDVDRVVKKPLLHQLFDLVGPPKVSQPIERPLKISSLTEGGPPFRKETNNNLKTSSSTDKLHKEFVSRGKRSSLCEDCDDNISKGSSSEESTLYQSNDQSLALLKWRNGLRNSKSIHLSPNVNHILNALSRSEGNMNKKRSTNRSTNSRRRRSVTTFSEDITDAIIAEETCRDTYVPLTNNSTFQRLRRQLISDYSVSNRYYATGSSWSSLSSLESIARPLSSRQDGRPQHRQPSKCGDWVRTFPYNAATLHGSRNPIYIKSLVAELLKYKKTCEKVSRENMSTDDEMLNNQVKKLLWGDHILWSPKKL